MMRPRTAVIVFSLQKHCFVCVPESWKVNAGVDSQASFESCIDLLFYRRLANGTIHCAGSATYQISFRLPIPNPNPNLNPNPNPKTDPNRNPNPKSNKNVKRHRS